MEIAAEAQTTPPLYPLHIRHQADSHTRYFRIRFWPKEGRFFCKGIRSFVIDPETYRLLSVRVGEFEALRGGATDIAAYSLGSRPFPSAAMPNQCYWPFPISYPISVETPAVLRGWLMQPFAAVPVMNLVLYGHLPERGDAPSAGPFVTKVDQATHPAEIEPCYTCNRRPPYDPASLDPVAQCSDCATSIGMGENGG